MMHAGAVGLALLVCSFALVLGSPVHVAVQPRVGVTLMSTLAGTAANKTAIPLGQFNSHHGVKDEHPSASTALKTRPARWLKPDSGLYTAVPARPGLPHLPDLAYFRKPGVLDEIVAQVNATHAIEGDAWNLELAFLSAEWPQYMLQPGHILPTNITAAAEMHLAFLSALHAFTGVLPTHVEVVNEPDTKVFSAEWDSVVALYGETGKLLRGAFGPQISVGGPTLSDTQFASGGFKRVSAMLGPFLDPTPGSPRLDFWSFHAFDSYRPSCMFTGAGGHLHGVLDLLAGVALNRTGAALPVFPTERGFASDNPLGRGAHSVTELRALQIQSHVSQLLTFADRADELIASSAFLLDGGYSCQTNPSVSIVNCTTGALVSGATVFQFIRDVLAGKERRLTILDGHGDPLNVVAAAFADATDLRVVVVNLLDRAQPINLTVTGAPPSGPASLQRFYLSADGHLEHNMTATMSSLHALSLFPHEACVIRLPIPPSSPPAPPLQRWSFHAPWDPSTATHVRGAAQHVPIPVRLPAASLRVQRAVVRVTYGRALYQPATELGLPVVHANGLAIPEPSIQRLPSSGCAYNETGHSEWFSWEAELPPAAWCLGCTLDLTLAMPSETLTGTWGSATLILWGTQV